MKKIELEKIIIFILAILVLLPSTIKICGISIIKISFIIIFTILILIIYKKKINIYNLLVNKYFIISIIYPLAILVSLLINIKSIKMNDIFEIFRYIMYYMVVIIVYYICKDKKHRVFLYRTITVTLILMCIYGIIQYFDLFSINEKIVKSYAPTQYVTLVNSYSTPRIISTKPNPAVYGVIVSIGIYINLIYLKLNRKSKLPYFCIFLCIINLMLTLTRTIQLAFMMSLIIYLFIKLYRSKGWETAICGSTITIILLIILIIILPNSITWRLKSIADLSSTTSWNARIDKWQGHIKEIKDNILFGTGPMKNYISKIGYMDSEWLQTVYQYGIFGLIGYIIMLLMPAYYLISNNKKRENIVLYIPILIMIFINNIAASSTISFDTCIIISILIGMLLNNVKEVEGI